LATTPDEEALRLTTEVLSIIMENKSFSVTNLLRRCARIAELLQLEDILWIDKELKGYTDDAVPPYRQIEVRCHYGWIGSLESRILEIRGRKELFYKKWTEKITVRESSVMLELWAKSGHSGQDIRLRETNLFGVNVTEIALISVEQVWEILHRISDTIREFASRTDKKLQGRIMLPKKGESKVRAFLSASFNDEIDPLVSWFNEMIRSLDVDVVWLKEKYQARPTEEKIKENIKLCNCFIQIITREVKEAGKEAGWLGNEIAWAKDSTPNGNMAIFVEKGTEATGLAKVVADNLQFDRADLSRYAPKITQYLYDLKKRVLSPY
jgi:methyl-accepting chemotaxis protein